MAFVEYKTAGCKSQVRDLLRNRLFFKSRIRYHLKKIELHKEKIDNLKEVELPKVEKQLDFYLKKAGN